MQDSMSNLKELQPEVKTKLASQGIRTTTQLLEHTRPRDAQRDLSKRAEKGKGDPQWRTGHFVSY